MIERGLRGSYAKFLSDSDHPEIEVSGRAFVDGMIQPTVLVDGFVEGKRRIALTDKKATLNIDAFRRLTKAEKTEIANEGEALLVFVATNSKARDIKVSGP